jgi:ABC-type oligopeptide transport system substrate-binding subunit
VRNVALAAAIAALVATSACKKTGEGEYQVEKPVIGTETDTLNTPSVETGTVTDTINVPDVDVNTEKKEVKLPKVDVETPSERAEEGN